MCISSLFPPATPSRTVSLAQPDAFLTPNSRTPISNDTDRRPLLTIGILGPSTASKQSEVRAIAGSADRAGASAPWLVVVLRSPVEDDRVRLPVHHVLRADMARVQAGLWLALPTVVEYVPGLA